jgi:arylsulfatase A
MSRLLLFVAVVLICSSSTLAADKPAARPNIVVILVDDLGYECLGVNGAKSYRTPNIDRLAGEGVRFRQCYAQPNCTPTRTQLMTGQYNVRNYVSFGTLEKSQVTFANMLHDAGYHTAIAGKWQLGSRDASLPKHFGFDEHCLWSHMGRGERYANPSLSLNGELKTYEGKYGPDLCQDFVFDFMRRFKEEPFVVYYPMILTHGPFEATPKSADWGKEMAKGKSNRQQHFADMVAYMDGQVGALEAELKRLGVRDNTLVLLTGDNGTGRGVVTELDDGSEQDGEKGSTTRGGMHVPLIAHWPGRVKAGVVSDDLVDMTDILPTVLEIAGVKRPADKPFDGRSLVPQLEGKPGTPREWIYSYWVPLREKQTAHLGDRGAVEQAFDRRYKLYSTGEFFDVEKDPEEKRAERVAELKGEAAQAAVRLQRALDQFKEARPGDLAEPKTAKRRKKGSA